jgi:protein arginine kinase activator
MVPVFDLMAAPITCSACGFSEVTFAKTLRLGCSRCYETFGPHLETMLPRWHVGPVHRGKRPVARGSERRSLRGELAGIESPLTTGPTDDRAATDDLLDRWKNLSQKLSAAGGEES